MSERYGLFMEDRDALVCRAVGSLGFFDSDRNDGEAFNHSERSR
ncbi:MULTISPECIES: hypothetical protein [unclassified Nocardia]|nr:MULTISPECIES: hypothetical protein [unclassified Nocardia]